NNHFLNATPIDDSPTFFDALPVRFILDRSVAGILVKIFLGEFSLFKKVDGDGKQPWNPQGWFELRGISSLADPFIGDQEGVTYRIGEDDPTPSGNPPIKRMKGDDGKWLPPDQILGDQILLPQTINDLSTLIRPVGRCDLYNTVKPDHATDFGEPV